MKNKMICIIIGMLLIATAFSVVGAIKNDTDNIHNGSERSDYDGWVMIGHDAANTGYSTSIAPDTNETLFVNDEITNGVLYGLSVDQGKVYVPIFGNYGGIHLQCFNAFDGELIFEVESTHVLTSVPLIDDNRIYFGGYDKYFYCLDANTGQELWSNYIGKGISASPTMSNDQIYVGTSSGGDSAKMICMDTDGNYNWNFTVPYPDYPYYAIKRAAAIFDGMVFFAATNNTNSVIYCLNASNGSEIWRYELETRTETFPVVVDGLVYVGSRKKMNCYDAYGNGDGTTTRYWSLQLLAYDVSSAAVANGKVYYSMGIWAVCVNAYNGYPIWSSPRAADIRSTPVVADGKVYFADSDDKLFCLNANTGQYIFDNVETGSPVQSQLAVYCGCVYAASRFRLICVGTPDSDPPETPNPPTGPTEGFIGYEYTYETDAVTDPDNDSVEYLFDWGDGTDSGWLLEPVAGHSWTEAGSFEVTVTARDVPFHVAGEPSDSLTVLMTNSAPLTPDKPDGPTNGFRNFKYTFSASTTDPEEQHQIRYGWDWGDGSNIEWTSFYDSGVTVELENKWNTIGTYNVSVMAQDEWGLNSSWSEPLVIVIIEPYPVFEINISGGKGITAIITNVGFADADEVDWTISIEGGFFFLTPKEKNGTIPAGIDVDESAEITMDVMGFGWGIIFPIPNITVTASAPDAETAEKSVNARVTFSNVKILEDESVKFHTLFSKILGNRK